MNRTLLISLSITLALAALAEDAAAQVRYRRPYEAEHRLNYGFDNNGSAGGCSDYQCGGACYNLHTGSDLGTPFGTPILAAAAGRVVNAHNGCPNYGAPGNTCGGSCGNWIQIEHADGARTMYCHLQLGSLTVGVGANVACGQTIGRSASSGSSSGPHLHFVTQPNADRASRHDTFSGPCGPSTSRWIEQRGYREAPGASCNSCTPGAETCDGRDQDCDARVDEGDVCEVALLNEHSAAYAPPTSTDVDGDGRADVCARGIAGVGCWVANGTGWGAPWADVPWPDASGWDDVANYATLRMGDLNGDRRADVCARSNDALICALSNGAGFDAHSVWREGLSDANGWANPRYYTTLRLADVNGDGMDDLCARDSMGFGCWLSDGARFDRRIEGPRWSDAAGFTLAQYYGTLRMGDVDGDGRADVCVRAAAGVRCVLSHGEGFETTLTGPEWSDAQGFGARQYWSTFRLADVDGDGRDDVCIRTGTDLRCVRSIDGGFGETLVVGALSDANGWGDVANYATLRVGDIDADGADDLCLRGDARMGCWAWDGTAFVQHDGPEWSDASGWAAGPQYYDTIRLADVDADGRDDLCARAGAGWRCHPSLGDGFGEAITLDGMKDESGWSATRYSSTILSAGNTCRAEMEPCNDRDDDCDGMVDEGLSCTLEPDAGGIDAGTLPRDAAAPPSTPDGGASRPEIGGGCSCRASGSRHDGGALLTALALLAFACWARRRQRRSPD